MENKEPNQQLTNEVQEGASLLARAKANSKLIVALSIFICAVLIGIMVWFFVAQSGSRKADEAIARADMATNDSVALVLYKQAAEHSYKSGNRAKIEVGMRLYQDGKYEDAVKYLDGASSDSEIIAAGIETLKGDCYVNLKNYDAALSAYKSAVSEANENPELVPIILVKEANVYREQKNYAAEAQAYETIIKQYPGYGKNGNVDIRKYYERANAAIAE